MKNLTKSLGIITLAAVIGFGVAGCEQPTDLPTVSPGGKTLTGITAAYTPTTTIYTDTTLDTLKEGLTVTATYSDSTTAPVTTYSLSVVDDTLIVGENTVTVTYTEGGVTKINTFTVSVSATHVHNWSKISETAATCTTAGVEVWECTASTPSHHEDRPGADIDPDNHDWNTETGLCDNDCGALYYELGDTGPGGGKIFYVSAEGFTMTDDNATAHYLEAAPADMATTLAWASSDYASTNIADTAFEIGTGRKNTALILATLNANAPAAKACNDYSAGGKTDWFLPSKDELNQLHVNRTSVGDMGGSDYWSSSQYNAYGLYAWLQNFSRGEGDQMETFKYAYSVRAVRAF